MRSYLSAAVASAGLTLIFSAKDAAAQRITHEVGGKQHTYEFNQRNDQGARSERQPGRKKSQAPWKPQYAPPLARGPKNIPWDEPGRNAGVPGLDKNPRSLSASRAASREHPSGRGPVQADGRPESRDDSGIQASVERPPRGEFVTGDAPTATAPRGGALERDHIGATAPNSHEAGRIREQAGVAKPQDANAEKHAEIIAEARSRASAEEQRRLERERSRDRHERPAEPRPRVDGTGPVALDPADPATTGAIAPRAAQPAPARPAWRSGICRAILFGMLPDC